jgi:hypothetical protein
VRQVWLAQQFGHNSITLAGLWPNIFKRLPALGPKALRVTGGTHALDTG